MRFFFCALRNSARFALRFASSAGSEMACTDTGDEAQRQIPPNNKHTGLRKNKKGARTYLLREDLLALLATRGGFLPDRVVHLRVRRRADLGLEELLNLASERLQLGCINFNCGSAKSARRKNRSGTSGGLAHLRVLSVRVLGDTEDWRRHLDDEPLQSGGIQEADDSGEPAQDGGGLARPLALQRKATHRPRSVMSNRAEGSRERRG